MTCSGVGTNYLPQYQPGLSLCTLGGMFAREGPWATHAKALGRFNHRRRPISGRRRDTCSSTSQASCSSASQVNLSIARCGLILGRGLVGSRVRCGGVCVHACLQQQEHMCATKQRSTYGVCDVVLAVYPSLRNLPEELTQKILKIKE